MANQNLEHALRNLADQSGDIMILFMFTAGLLVILVIIWVGFKYNEENYQTKSNIEKVENYLTKGVIYNLPRDLGNGFTEYDIDNMIIVQDDVQQYNNRYDLHLIRTSDEESEDQEDFEENYLEGDLEDGQRRYIEESEDFDEDFSHFIPSAESYETIV